MKQFRPMAGLRHVLQPATRGRLRLLQYVSGSEEELVVVFNCHTRKYESACMSGRPCSTSSVLRGGSVQSPAQTFDNVKTKRFAENRLVLRSVLLP